MSITYSQLEQPGRIFPFQSMSYNHDGGRHGQDRRNRHYRLPPPHSSIPIGFIVDNQHTTTEQRTDVSRSRNDVPTPRENLPSVHQLLSDRNTRSYLPPLPRSSPQYTLSRQSSPSMPSRPHTSHYTSSSAKSESCYSDHASMSPSSDGAYENYSRGQSSARLPPISQVGMETSRKRQTHGSSSHFVSDEDSPRSHSTSRDPTASPRHSDPSLFHFVSSPKHEGGGGGGSQKKRPSSRGPAAPNQVVDERYLPGKGVCYIFADNSYCPKLIDGQPVNPDWGLTKAGKARKRLAQACIPCREKKVKCQPNSPKCDQCQKSGRECRFESA